MGKFFHRQLAKKMTLYVILISTFFALFSSAFQVYSEYKKEVGFVYLEIEQIEKTHLANISSQVWSLDNNGLRVIAVGLLDLPSIEYIAIYSENDIMLEEGSDNFVNTITKSFVLTHKYKGKSIVIGKMVLKATLDNIYQNVIDRALLIIFINAIKTFIVSSLILFIFYRFISRHLNDISNFIQEIDLNTFEGKFLYNRKENPPNSQDELDIINSSFFNMLNKLVLSEKKQKLAANVFTYAREGIFITDEQGTIIDVNETFTTTTGYSRKEAIGKNPRILNSGKQSARFYSQMWQVLLEKGHWSGEIWNRRKNGEEFPEILNISSVKDSHGEICNYVALFSDITEMKEHQFKLEHIAHYDLLTNLPNRVLLADRLSQSMLQCNRKNQSVAVVFLDLDGFKVINDAYGHDVGDELLIELSVRMNKSLRESDSLARIGGDEFVAVLAGLDSVESCKPILDRLLLSASEPIVLGDAIFQLSASMGVTLYPQDKGNADQLMRHADQAMYLAKQAGKNRYHFFDTTQDDAIKSLRESVNAVRQALDNQEFILFYQPKVNMKSGIVIGAEALIRWQHPERGLLGPMEFLPAIENTPMIIEIGEWVISTALKQISDWQKEGLKQSLSISVNIAAVQIQQPEFTERLTQLLAENPDVNAQHLELEILETSALNDVQNISQTMNSCLALGVNFALDDFGTGYSSLTHLRRLPANLIKIDQSFVRDMLEDADDLSIVEGVIALTKSFKREVIAEGVESIEHGEVLLALGCELAQGYGIAKPMPADNILEWIKEWEADDAWVN